MLSPKLLLPVLLAAAPVAALFLPGCAHDPRHPGNDAEVRPVIRGELSYRARIALPPDAVAKLELRAGPAPSGAIIAEREIPLDGRQVPIDFTLEFDPQAIPAGAGAVPVFQGALESGGDRRWISEPMVIDRSATTTDLGVLMLERPGTDVTVSELRCGERRARATASGEELVLEAAGQRWRLSRVVSASGARYQRPGDRGTEFWNKGEQATLRLAGRAWPECEVRRAPPLRARGNEPGWLLELDTETLVLNWDYGERVLAANTPAAVFDDKVTSYGTRVDDRRLLIAVHDRLCADGMTGMPHPKRVIVSLDDRVLRGCGGEPEDLLTGEWVIEDVNGRGIIDASRATVVFDGEGRIGGRGSCNSYGGSYELSGEGLAVSDLFSTQMACVEALMRQEQRVLAILEAVRRFDINETGALILHADDGRTLTARR